VTYTRCIDTINSPDDGHRGARNTWRIEIDIYEKELCVKLVIYKDVQKLCIYFKIGTINYGLENCT
jgi:hypothetical protein